MTRLAVLLWLLVPLGVHGVEVVDEAGKTVRLAKPALRIVSLSPHATELLYAIGAGAQLVGRDGASDYPPQAAKLSNVGQYGTFNVEAIIALRPDLVVAWEGPQAGVATERLRSLGIAVYASQPATIAAIPQAMRALGTLAGRDGESPARRFETAWAAMEARYRQRPVLKVVAQVGAEPAMTVNEQQFVSGVFRACGTVNPFGAERAAVPLISAESLLVMRPDVIVALAKPEAGETWLAPWRKLPLKTAYLTADPDTLGRPGPRLLPAAQALCQRLDALRQARVGKID
ncbi:TroA family protein [Chitinimonas naiadis]